MRRQPVALWPVVVPLVVIGLALAPWLPQVTGAVERVAQHGGYHVVGSVVDAALALAVHRRILLGRRSLWPWMVAALLVLAPALAVVLLRGVRAAPVWLAFVAPAAVVAFVGAYQWRIARIS